MDYPLIVSSPFGAFPVKNIKIWWFLLPIFTAGAVSTDGRRRSITQGKEGRAVGRVRRWPWFAGAPITQGKEGGAEGRAGFRENSRRGGCSHLPGPAVSPSKKIFFAGGYISPRRGGCSAP